MCVSLSSYLGYTERRWRLFPPRRPLCVCLNLYDGLCCSTAPTASHTLTHLNQVSLQVSVETSVSNLFLLSYLFIFTLYLSWTLHTRVCLSSSWRWAVSVDKREIPEGQKEKWREKLINLKAKGSDWGRIGKCPPVLCSCLITDCNRKQRFVLKRGQNALCPHFHEWKEPSGGRRSVNNSGVFSGVQIQVLNTGFKHESTQLKLLSPLTSTCSSLHVTQHQGGANNIWQGRMILRPNNNSHKWLEERH